MRRFSYFVLACAIAFEVLRWYLMRGFPGTANVESLQVAQFLHANRWILRGLFLLLATTGAIGAFRTRRKWLPAAAALAAAALVWLVDSRTDLSRFEPLNAVRFGSLKSAALNDLDPVIGLVRNGEAKAYAVKYVAFHHKVRDDIGGTPVIVTYCFICGTARVYEPVVNGRPEQFRLVALNRHNAVYEDATTGSWWMQATGRAEAGPLEGAELKEWEAVEFSAGKFLDLYPNARFMLPVATDAEKYAVVEKNARRLNRSWVVRVESGPVAKAVDWATLVKRRLVTDKIGDKQVTLVLGNGGVSISAFEYSAVGESLSVASSDVLSLNGHSYDFAGRAIDLPGKGLARASASMQTAACWKEFEEDDR